ncbi:unnamed protein product [Sphagnum troendelagicum]|uniref:Uncharacterized protein n=1 Tax=Sphagnum troendelagicum TaxID=128251 RepID=A0ABP0T799_9BRYO
MYELGDLWFINVNWTCSAVKRAIVVRANANSGEDALDRGTEPDYNPVGGNTKRTVDKRQVRWDYAQSTALSRSSLPPPSGNATQHASLSARQYPDQHSLPSRKNILKSKMLSQLVTNGQL